MAKVKNWQLGREMTYPYEEARPAKQFAMVIDPNKCISCQTCTVACKSTWTSAKGQEYMFFNNVETKPYGSFPTGWDLKSLSLLGEDQTWDGETYKGKTVFEASTDDEPVVGWMPESEHWASPNLGEDEPNAPIEQGAWLHGMPQSVWMFYLQRVCNHCSFPACLAACPRKAIYKRDDGFVLIDQSRCRGYRECTKACPYKKIFFNNNTRVSEKCIGCYPLLEAGEMNRCVSSCIGRIRMSGFKNKPDEVDPKNPLDWLIHVRKVVLPLYPQFGTEPNVYYFPPIHAPAPFLKQMFGPGVERAVAAYRAAMEGKDPELQGLLMLFAATNKIIHRFEVEGGKARGFDEKGELLTEVPIQEPAVVRPSYDKGVGARRTNIS